MLHYPFAYRESWLQNTSCPAESMLLLKKVVFVFWNKAISCPYLLSDLLAMPHWCADAMPEVLASPAEAGRGGEADP